MTAITTQELTEASLDGTGVFDHLMRASKAHLEEEYSRGRIKGPEYAQVYLGTVQANLQYSIQFLLEKQRADQQAELLKAQVVTEGKQQALLTQQELNLTAEKLKVEADTTVSTNTAANLLVEKDRITAQTAVLTAQETNLGKEGFQIEAQTSKIDQETTNLITQNTVLVAEECKLRAEYDVLLEQKLKTVSETALLGQKKATEKAQITGLGVDADSVIGRQKNLYLAQADGFKRDAEQKAAKVLVDSWNVRRTTDEATQANVTNKLDDASVGQAVNALLSGVSA